MGVRGSITDRPWGATLVALRGLEQDAELELVSARGECFQIAFRDGLVVAATSSHSADSVARVALSSRLASPQHAKLYATVEDVERFGEHVGLNATQRKELARRVLLQRVARTFAIDDGHYEVESCTRAPLHPEVSVDIRAAIYLGMHTNLSQQRLTRTRHRVGGARFLLRPGAAHVLPAFELGPDEEIVIEALRTGTSVAELEAAHRELDPRMVEALLCTLAICEVVSQTELAGRTPTPRVPTMTPVPRTGSPETTEGFAMGDAQRTKLRPPALARTDVHALIELGNLLLERGVDHFTFLGLPFGATPDAVREAYVEFARYLRPEALEVLGIDGREAMHANAVFAQIVIAYTVLTEPSRRREYVATLPR